MLTPEQTQRITRTFLLLQRADAQLVRDFQQAAFFVQIPSGKDVFVEGDRADAIALLMSGEVRVYKIGETGREITLYRFGFGGSCVLTANAILSQQSFPAIATVVYDAEAILIPAETFRKWVNRYELWREFGVELWTLGGSVRGIEEGKSPGVSNLSGGRGGSEGAFHRGLGG